jgi:hypothetical protein
LFVEVTVEHHGVAAARAGGRHLEIDQRRAPFQADQFELQACHLAALDPGRGVTHHAVEVAMRRPVGIEHRALRWNADVVVERRHDLLVPASVGVGGQCVGVVGQQRQVRVTGVHGGLLMAVGDEV